MAVEVIGGQPVAVGAALIPGFTVSGREKDNRERYRQAGQDHDRENLRELSHGGSVA